MNKTFTYLVALLLLASAFPLLGQTVTFSVGNQSASNGQQVCLPVKVTGFTDVLVFSFGLTYDPSALRFDSIRNVNFNVPGWTPDTYLSSFGRPGTGNIPAGRLNVLGGEVLPVTSATLPDGTTIFEVCFTIIDASAASTPINFANSPREVINKNTQRLTFNGQGGTVTITGGGGGSSNLTVRIPDKTVQSGQQVCVDVTVDNFTDIAGFNLGIQYDPARLQFISVGSFNLPNLTTSSFGTPTSAQNQTTPGLVTVSWEELNFNGVTRSNGTVLFQVCFNATGGSGTTNLNFVAPLPTVPIEFNDENRDVVPHVTDGGVVTITGTGGGGGNDTTLTVRIADQSVQGGQQVCVNVTVDNFKNIAGFNLGIQYDPAKLQFVSVGNFNLPGLNATSIGTPTSTQNPTAPGLISVTWSEANFAGVTRANGAALFQICFNAIGSNTTANLNFVNPDQTSPIEFFDPDEKVVPHATDGGVITITGMGGGTTDPTIRIQDQTVQSGQQVCVNITVDNFNNIAGINLGIQYDPARLEYVSIGNFNLPGLAQSSFGLPSGTPDPTPAGRITLVWSEANFAGVDRPNGAVLFQICFRAIGSNGTTTNVTFVAPGTISPIEFVDENEDVVPFVLDNGVITIGTGGGGCTGAPTLAPPAITQVNCFGQSTGVINITPQGGSGNFTYRWNNNATTQDLMNIPAGTYAVTVTDATCNLTVSATYNITQPTTALNATSQVTNIACGAAANSGAIALTTTGGTAPYQFNWSGTLPDNVTTQSNLAVGTYSVTITDNRGCTFALPTINVTSLSTVNISSIVPTNINQQGNNGAVAITVQGGNAPFTYAWRGPNNYTSTQEDISGLSAPGEYCVTVTDAQSCTATRCTVVTAPLTVNGQINRPCSGESSGSITLTVSGGVAPYTYRWSNNATTQNLTNISAGNYTVTITDSQNTTNTSTFEVNSYAAIVLNAQITNTGTGTSNGRIVLNISGGTSPYTIKWENNATRDTLTNLAADEYCVTVTDSRGCTKTGCYMVAIQDAPLAVSNIVTTRVTCPGGTNGSLSLQVVGGQAPYNIAFSDNTNIPQSNGTVVKNNLPGGAFSYTITDAVGTIFRDTVDIPQPAPFQLTNLQVTHDSEESGCTGRIAATVVGGTPPYLLQWNAPNTGTGTPIINLCEGNFIPTVRDSNGCIQVLPAVEVTTFRANGATTAASCPQDTNGVVALTITGGTKPYGFTWRNSNNVIISTADTLKNVAPGIYTVRVTEQSGNIVVKQFTVGSISNLNADVEVISDYNGRDISCRNATDGIIEANVTSGSGTYTYEWRRGTTVLATTPVLNGVGVGTYQVAVKDALGCTITKQVSIVPPDTIQVLANIREISCIGNRDGEIIVTATGGAIGKPYSFVWSTSASGPRISFLSPGTYQVTATDANNCSVATSFTLAEPKPIQVAVETQPATDGCNGVALAKVEGGTAPYNFRWNAPNATGALVDDLCAGTYSVVVTDSRGCTAPAATGFVSDQENPCYQAQAIITPENDGVNDQFQITCSEIINNHLEVYNRWGQLVFQADNYDNTWEGTTQGGDPLPEGPYYFVFEYTDSNGKLIQQKGSLTILRRK